MNTNNTSGSTPQFKIGQRVVAIKDCTPEFGSHYKKGDEFTVNDIKRSPLKGVWHMSFINKKGDFFYVCDHFAPIEENKERIRYVAVSETLREKAEEVVVESCNLS